jgi:hypothetical protein
MKNTLTYIGLGLIILSVGANIFLFTSLKSKENEVNKQKQNVKALKDSLRKTREGGKDVYSTGTYDISSIKDIKDNFPELYDEIKSLNDGKNVKTINKTKVITDTQYKDVKSDYVKLDSNRYKISWNYTNSDSSRVFTGNSSFNISHGVGKKLFENDSTYYFSEIHGLNNIESNISRSRFEVDLVIGQREKDGYREVFVKPLQDDVRVGRLKGARIIPESEKQDGFFKRLELGTYVGAGLNYNPFNQRLQPGVQAGFGVSYRITN